MNRSVVWVTMASAQPMGQQNYEASLQAALRQSARGDWRFSSRRIMPLRSQNRGGVRLPLRALEAAPRLASEAVGQVAYGRASLAHRFDLHVPPRLGREVVTVHDLPPLRFQDEGQLSERELATARRAVGVICPSQFAAAEVDSLLRPRRLWVIPYGVNEGLGQATPLSADELASFGILGRFVLHAAGATTRKNLNGLAVAWRRVAARCPDTTLVLCGPPHPTRERLFGDAPQCRYLGRLGGTSIARLMQASAAVIVPSIYEGFGLPALEGMAAGVPVVAADRGALPEVCGTAALLVPPTADGLADGLIEVLTDARRAAGLRERGPRRAATFNWSKAAEETLAVYEEALA